MTLLKKDGMGVFRNNCGAGFVAIGSAIRTLYGNRQGVTMSTRIVTRRRFVLLTLFFLIGVSVADAGFFKDFSLKRKLCGKWRGDELSLELQSDGFCYVDVDRNSLLMDYLIPDFASIKWVTDIVFGDIRFLGRWWVKDEWIYFSPSLARSKGGLVTAKIKGKDLSPFWLEVLEVKGDKLTLGNPIKHWVLKR